MKVFLQSTILIVSVVVMLLAGMPVQAADLSEVGCGCVGLNNPFIAPCSEARIYKEGLSNDPASMFLSLFWWWKLYKGLNEAEKQGEAEMPAPSLAIEAAPTAVVPGETITLSAVAQNYRTRYQNMYFSWCVGDKKGNYNSYNSVIAGGRLAQVADIPVPGGAGACCGWLTRDPYQEGDTDSNNNGLGDNWVRLNFTGKTINGVLATPENVLDLVKPEDDPDADGFVANRFFNRRQGEFITLTPGLVDHLGNRYIPGRDGRFSNIMEYIVGTDPLNGDTSGDGYGDEMAFIGVGQNTFQYEADKFAGITDYFDIMVSTVGIDQRKVAYIASNSRRLFVTPAQRFLLNLSSDRDLLPVGAGSEETVTVTADLQQGEVNPATLVYEWSLQGENICEADNYSELSQFCGQGKNELILGGDGPLAFVSLPGLADLELGEDYSIKVTATDAVTRQTATAEIKLLRAATLELSTDCGTDSLGLDEIAAGGREAVTICVGSYGIQVDDTEKITYQWYKDGKFEQAQSGVGKDTYELRASKYEGSSHQVSLRAKAGYSQSEEMSGAIIINIVGPKVRIIEPADRLDFSDDIAQKQSRYIAVTPGEIIDFSAVVSGFGEDLNYTWEWTASDQEFTQSDNMLETSTFSHTVPENLGVGAKYNLTVIVRGEKDGELIDAVDGLSVVVVPESSQPGAAQKFFNGMAAAFSWLPPQSRLAVQIALLVIIALAAVGGVGYAYVSFFNKTDE
jgi:hypothetical protein